VAARARVFSLTWLSYASYYLCRKPLSVAKVALSRELSISISALGAMETAYLIAYAIGQFASGLLGDRFGARRLLIVGMLLSAAATAWFGLSSGALVLGIAFALNGLAQSTGWPATVKAMTPWFAPEERGKIMGPWSTCYQIGGLAATALATTLLVRFGWRSSFLVPAAWLAGVAVLVACLLPAPAPSSNDSGARADLSAIRAALAEPLLCTLGLSYFVLKLIRYVLLFWLPFFMHERLGYSQARAGYQSLAFELGGALGAISAGALSDRLVGRRGLLAIAMTTGLALACFLYVPLAHLGSVPNFLGLALIGFMLFGPDSLVSSIAAQDLGGSDGASTAAGVINGIGSLGAVVQGIFVGAWVKAHGWDSVFSVFVALSLISALALVPFARARVSARS